MTGRRWAALLLALLAVCWGGLGYWATKPTDYHDYRVVAVQSAQSAYFAVATAGVAGKAKLDGRVFDPYLSSVLADARDALAGAAKEFAGKTPPDEATIQMRDQLGPMLLAANATLGAVQSAAEDSDEAALREAVGSLAGVSQQLSDFIEAHQ